MLQGMWSRMLVEVLIDLASHMKMHQLGHSPCVLKLEARCQIIHKREENYSHAENMPPSTRKSRLCCQHRNFQMA